MFHVKRGGLLEFIYLLCFTWNMGNACKRNLLCLQSCFLVFEGFSMFHVKHWLFFVGGGCFTWNMGEDVCVACWS